MRNFRKQALAWLCVFMLCFPCADALAEFSPRYEALSQGDGMTVAATGSIESLSPLSKQSVQTLNDWLSRVKILISQGKNTQGEIQLDGDTLYAVSVQKQSGYTLTTFYPSAGAYLTEPQGRDALSILTDADEWIEPAVIPQLYAALAPELYAKLAEFAAPKTTKEPTSIKNAARSASYENYTFKDGELNAAWPALLDVILPKLKDALSGQPVWYARAEELLRGLVFSGECRFKRFLDKDGQDLGMQFTGNAAKGEDKRKVTLFGGYTPDKGGYLSLTLPAVKGKNNLKITLAEKLTQKNGTNTLEAEGTYTRTMDGQTVSATLDGTLKNVIKEEAERWTGKITLTKTENKVKTTWVLSPDVSFTDEGLAGKVAVQKKEGSKVTAKGSLELLVTPYQALTSVSAGSAKDLRGLAQERARTALLSELSPLSGVVAQLASALPEKDRTQLLHDLRTDAWMNGPVVPVQQENTAQPADAENSWTVEEDQQ
jgi:hypothetical protein